MEEEEIKIKYEKNLYLYKNIYLIRTNIPTSEILYMIMFFLKYIGFILLNISLNELINEKKIKNEIPNLTSDSSTIINFHSILLKLTITGDSMKMLSKNYEEICLTGFFILIIYILSIIYGLFYMKNKYYNNKIITFTEKKIKKINNSSKIEKHIFQIIAYIFFLIAFFHQYIIEYYLFGFLGHIFKLFGIFTYESINKSMKDEYSIYIRDYFKQLNISEVFILVANLITVIIILILFILFMIFNSTKSLFINIGIPFYGSKIYLILKLIIFNYNPFYGLINMLTLEIQKNIILILACINLVFILMDLFLSFYKFSFYPTKVSYMCIFIEFFSLFSNIN